VALTSQDSAGETTGIGLRLPHLKEVLATSPDVAWLEIHPENFIANPHATEILGEIARLYPVGFHNVGLSVGSADGIDRNHLHRIRSLMDMFNPFRVSGHLAWSVQGGKFLNDLLPIPYTTEALQVVQDGVSAVQDALGRRYLVENPASYFSFDCSTSAETDFLNELASRTGCGLLCDVSNIVVSANNLEFDAEEYLNDLDPEAVKELHVGGYSRETYPYAPYRESLIDTHAAPISSESWKLFERAACRFPDAPVLVEWDNALPDLGLLVGQAATAERIRARVSGGSHVSAG